MMNKIVLSIVILVSFQSFAGADCRTPQKSQRIVRKQLCNIDMKMPFRSLPATNAICEVLALATFEDELYALHQQREFCEDLATDMFIFTAYLSKSPLFKNIYLQVTEESHQPGLNVGGIGLSTKKKDIMVKGCMAGFKARKTLYKDCAKNVDGYQLWDAIEGIKSRVSE